MDEIEEQEEHTQRRHYNHPVDDNGVHLPVKFYYPLQELYTKMPIEHQLGWIYLRESIIWDTED